MMDHWKAAVAGGGAAGVERGGPLIDGEDWVAIDRQDRDAFRAQVDARLRGFLDLYEAESPGERPPSTSALGRRAQIAAGLGQRLLRLRLTSAPRPGRIALPGQRFTFDPPGRAGALFTRPLAAQAVSRLAVGACLLQRPHYFSITGRLGQDYLYRFGALLPLRGQQAEIVELLLPFFCKLGDIPARLREEFFAGHVEHP